MRVVALWFVAVLAAPSAMPVSSASFSSTTASAANGWDSATLSPASSLAAAVDGSDIDLTWTATPDPWADGYQVWRSETSGCCYVLHDTVVGQASTSYTDLGAATSGSPIYETGATASNNGTNLVVSTPTGTADGDLLLAVVSGENHGASLSAPAGWTQIFQGTSPSNFVMAVWYRVASSEPATRTFSSTISHAMNGAIIRYSGADQTTPIDASGWATAFGNPVAPDITTTVGGTTVVRMGSLEDSSVSDIGYPPGTNGRIEFDIVPGQVTSVADLPQATAGPTGTATFTGSGDDYVAATIALTPGGSPDYYYVVRAYRLGWSSVDSNEATATG